MLDIQNQGPQCTACGSSTKLTAIEPGAPGQDLRSQDLRTFTCPRCNRVQRYIIDSAVSEAWLAPTEWSACNASGEMDQSYFREQADRCRRLARDSTDPVLMVSLRRLADEHQMRADEIENDEISASAAP
jgi:transcription elongation factor Elf1